MVDWPDYDTVLVHLLTGETYSMFEHCPQISAVRGWTAHGACWIHKLKLFRPAMSGERRAHNLAWFRRTGWRAEPPAIRNQPAIHAPTYVAYDYEDNGSNNGHWHIYTTDHAPDFVEFPGASVLVIRAAQTNEMRAAVAAICDRIDAAIAVAVRENGCG